MSKQAQASQSPEKPQASGSWSETAQHLAWGKDNGSTAVSRLPQQQFPDLPQQQFPELPQQHFPDLPSNSFQPPLGSGMSLEMEQDKGYLPQNSPNVL